MTACRGVLLAFLLTLGSASTAFGTDDDRYDVDNVRGISRFTELYAKATVAQRERRSDEALALVQQAIALQPKNPLGALALAELHLLAGRRSEAGRALDVADPLTGSRDARMRTRVLMLRAIVAEKTPDADALAAWLVADGWVSEMNVTGPERAAIRQRVEAHEKMRGQKTRDDAVRARIAEGEAKAATP